MAVQDVKTTGSQIRRGELKRLYYIYGADVVQVGQLTRQLLRKAVGSEDDFSVTKYEGKDLNVQELADAAATYPMFSDYNCIWIQDLNAEQLREDALKILLEVCKTAGEQTILIFSIIGFDIKDGKKSPTAKNKKLIDCIAKQGGVVCEAAQPTAGEIARQLVETVQQNGCSIQRETAVFLAERCHGDTLRIQNEMEKLCAYADGGTITKEMIELLTTPAIETTVYELAKAVLSMRPRAAMAELDRLYAMRTNRTFIVHAVATAFQDLYRASAAWRNHHTEEEVKSDFDYRFDFVVRNAFRDCRRIQPEHIRACMVVLRELEQTLNSSSADERTLLETAIVKMLEIASGRQEQIG